MNASKILRPWYAAAVIAQLFAFAAQAAPSIDTPEVLLERARQGAEEFVFVAFDMEQAIPDMRSREEAEPFFEILDDLEAIAATQDFTAANRAVFTRMASILSICMIRWISIEIDDVDTVLRHHRWVEFSTAYDFLADTKLSVRKNAEKNFRLKAAGILEALLAWARAKNGPAYLINGYRELIGEVAYAALKDSIETGDLTDEERMLWASKIKTPESMTALLSDLFTRSAGIAPGEDARVRRLVGLLTHLERAITADPLSFPEYIRGSVADNAMRIALEMIRSGILFAGDEFERLTAMLRSTQLSSLATQWMEMDLARTRVTPEFEDQLFEKGAALEALMQKSDLQIELKAFREYRQKSGAAIEGRRTDATGTYKLVTAEGREFLFTVFLARRGMLMAGLGDAASAFRFAFTNVQYDPVTKVFTGSEHSMESWSTHNHMVRFRFRDGKVQCQFPNLTADLQKISGERVERFTNYSAQTPAAAQEPAVFDARYKGVFRDLRDPAKAMTAELEIGSVGKNLVGRLMLYSDPRFATRIHFNMGNQLNPDGVVMLTSSDTDVCLHLSGRIEAGRFVGEYIIAGKGLHASLELQRVEAPVFDDSGSF